MPKRTPAAKSPGKIVAEQIKHHRLRRQMSQTELAEAMTAQGIKMHQPTVANIENGQRKVTVDELLLFAVALGVPPGMLLFGVGQEPAVALTPSSTVHPHLAHQWLEGEMELDAGDPRWGEVSRPLTMFKELRRLVDQLTDARKASFQALLAGDAESWRSTRSALADAYMQVEDHVARMQREGVTIDEDTTGAIDQAVEVLKRREDWPEDEVLALGVELRPGRKGRR